MQSIVTGNKNRCYITTEKNNSYGVIIGQYQHQTESLPPKKHHFVFG